VPADWDRWTEDCRRMVIAHETAHIERRDGLVQLLEALARAAYFFHPAVWLLTRELGVYREMACDDAAVSKGPESPVEYSGHLVEVAERMLAHPVGCHSASALLRQRNELLDRVKYQVKGGEMRLLSRSTKRVILVGLLVLSVPLSWYCGRAETESVGSAQVPDTAPTAARKSTSLAYVEVIVGAKGDIKVDGKPVLWENLKRELEAKAGSDADRNVIVIRCADGAKMGSVSDLQKVLVKTGLTKVSYQDAEGNALALILPGEREKELLKQIGPDDVSTLVVEPDGGVSVDGRHVRIAEVKDIVRKLLVRNPYLVVSIRTRLATEYGDFHAVLDQVKAAGAKRISVG
jgi:biopolymer transport protein ExbD